MLLSQLGARLTISISSPIIFKSNSSLQNIAQTSGTDQVEAINFDPNNWFSCNFSADGAESKDKLLPYHSVTNGHDKRVEGGPVISTAQVHRKQFLAPRKLLTDIDQLS